MYGGSTTTKSAITVERTPTGMLMKKTQCQLSASVIHPPRTGPMIGPKLTPIPKMAIAIPYWLGGNDSRRMAWDKGGMAPPERPWRILNTMRLSMFHEAPHRKELIVKVTMEKMR